MSQTQCLAREVDAATGDKLRQIVIDVLKLEIAPHQISGESSLQDLGLESMSVVELLTQIEIAFDVVIDVDDLSVELFARFDTLLNFVGNKIDESR